MTPARRVNAPGVRVQTQNMAADEIHETLRNALTTWGTDRNIINAQITHLREALAVDGYSIVLTETVDG